MVASPPQLAMAVTFLPLILGFTLALSFTASAGEGEGTWCIAKPSSSYETLRNNIDYSCGQAGIDCRSIQQGGDCFYPQNVISHASFAMNLFYRASGKHAWDCSFSGTGLVVNNNPSIGDCDYPA